ncbi:hypothetical protein GQ457_12G014510 [Hibiscus cannabinus]
MGHLSSRLNGVVDVSTSVSAPIVDPEVLPQGPITRSKAKQFREALFLTCAKLSDSFDINCALELKCVNLNSAPFSSFQLKLSSTRSKLNNPEVAETRPTHGRVSYEHVDSKRGVLHLSMHMHNMCGSLGMLWACGRDLGTSQACGWLNQPLSLHLFPPKWNSLTTVLDP